ncbi:MAG: MFS transporter [Gammaproteobacteria bacterium]|nr:MFS transporter [Gammaproteobacteria bacterium]
MPALRELTWSHMVVMALAGFASGLPLALSGGTLQAWLTTADVDIRTIGLFSLVGLPYACKFLWAPFLDRYVPAYFGRRRGWMLLSQLAIMAVVTAMAFASPSSATKTLALLACLLAFASATQDIAADAYRVDLLSSRERGPGAALSIAGYRLAMIVSSSVALIMAEHAGWTATYLAMAALMLTGVLVSVFGPEPAQPVSAPESLDAAVVQPFREFRHRNRALWLLAFIVLYKIGDASAASLTTAFLVRGTGFSLTDVGVVYKGVGLAATILGALAGGALLTRMDMWRALLWFGVLQAITNLGFMLLASIGKNYVVMTAVVTLENLAGGLGTAAFVAFLIALCDRRYSATQYALLSALSAVGRVIVGPAAGAAVAGLGWPLFFGVTFIAALPGLTLLIWLRGEVETVDVESEMVKAESVK